MPLEEEEMNFLSLKPEVLSFLPFPQPEFPVSSNSWPTRGREYLILVIVLLAYLLGN